ncbi:D-alanyl-D-alanine carboxypeptidase (penicillin-binding protein 5/6) [Stella humosa]|uniref:serine-type D-Ala-D-Ala carboxypeptidase n=1 Tax=Stella humosa TaxID=94 RepID=A0A3N1MFS9_9PROT|nr:D-alanyl-D-alanine carboxypeptidase family protein [Stella humosa]ROQ01587.1 D-alanyl-D-alanine carboxypeptidase (penicillin-binding protein 5/6) [Stella humosa]BBK31967.1 D-alanyl-D-alanine carboxypeptidase [Stella humosa]
MTNARAFLPASLSAAILAAALVLFQPAAARAQEFQTDARAAVVVDFDTGAVLYTKEADRRIPPASMSKIMTMYVVFDLIRQGKLALTDELPVSRTAWEMGGSKMFVKVDTRVKVEDLIRGVIVQSGNDACLVLAEGLAGSEAAFVKLMNEKAKSIGLVDSNFANVTGWPHPDHYMSANDLARLARRMIVDFPERYRVYSERDFTYGGIKQGNRNPLLYRPTGTDGLKTGHTDEAGYGLTASAVRDGRRLIMVVTGLPSMRARSQQSERLLEWAFREWENYTLARAGQAVETAEVWLGAAETVPLQAGADIKITIPRRSRDQIKAVAVYDGPVAAPIAAGQRIGTMEVRLGDRKLGEGPLVAGAAVDRRNVFGRLTAAVSHIVTGK